MRRTLILLALLAVAGCASQDIPNVTRVRVYDASFEHTWSAVVSSVAERAYPIQAVEKESGILSTNHLAMPSPGSRQFKEMVIMPRAPFAVWRDPEVSLNFMVTPEDAAHTRVQINTSIRALDHNWSGQWYNGHSTGKLEHEMLAAIGAKVELLPGH